MLTTLFTAMLLAAEPANDAAEVPTAKAEAKPEKTAEPNSISLTRGTQKILEVKDVKRLAVGDPTVFDVRALGGDQLLIIGMGPGRSNLLIFDSRGIHQSWDVTVRSGDMHSVDDSPLQLLLRDSPDARIRAVGDRVFVEGLVRTPNELRVLAEYKYVVVFAKLDPRVVDRRVLEINQELQRLGLSGARAVLLGRKKLVLEGAVGSEDERRKAQLVADSLFSDLLPYL